MQYSAPSKKVNFQSRKKQWVAEHTDYDRLILEVWTDGSISPELAVSEASTILIKHFEYFMLVRILSLMPEKQKAMLQILIMF